MVALQIRETPEQIVPAQNALNHRPGHPAPATGPAVAVFK